MTGTSRRNYMGFWGGLLIGLFAGTIIGVFTVALCTAAKDYDNVIDERNE